MAPFIVLNGPQRPGVCLGGRRAAIWPARREGARLSSGLAGI